MHKTKFYCTLFVTLCVLPLYGTIEEKNLREHEVSNELAHINTLVKATEENLARQKKLQALIENYKKVEKLCLTNPENTESLLQLAKSGKMTYDAICEANLSDYFNPDFLAELKKLKQIADKKSIPPVQS